MTEWAPLSVDRELQDGIDAHALVAKQTNALAVSPRAALFAARFVRMEQGYTMYDWREQYQRVTWAGITFRRIIDAGGEISYGDPVLIDYKTATWPWETKGGMTAKASGFQGTIYLLPPADLGPFTRWPEMMDYLVAPERGQDQIFTYMRNEADESNLVDAVAMVEEGVAKKRFPKQQGFGCKYCPFYDMCYRTDGWQKKYKRKEERVWQPAE